jgi:hypothetical protein
MNIYLDIHGYIQYLTLDSIPGRSNSYLDSLQIISRLPPKDRILFLISKLNIITDKIRQVEIHKGNFNNLPPDLEQDPR